jgi:hypothetical protein
VSIASLSLRGPDVVDWTTAGDGLGVVYNNWEASSAFGCDCFSGFYGPDCSSGAHVPALASRCDADRAVGIGPSRSCYACRPTACPLCLCSVLSSRR